MSQTAPKTGIDHPRFSRFYNRVSQSKAERKMMDPLRRKVTSKARGVVLEVGAGNGLNFPFYPPGQVERVEATEPDATMLTYATENIKDASVPVTLTQAPAEELPFADATFDSAVITLVFCSVGDPTVGMAEVNRVLKPGGTLLMVEHVRSHNSFFAWLQDRVTPLTKRISGNCHWNRHTSRTVLEAGFEMIATKTYGGPLLPIITLEARKT